MATSKIVRGTGVINADTRVVDMSDRIFLLDPNMSPLTALTMRLRKKQCINPHFQWLEDEFTPVWGQLAAASLLADLTFDVDDGTFFRPGDVVKCMENGEIVLVTGVDVNELTVIRTIGATAASDLADNGALLIIGNANEEGATSREVLSTLKVTKDNFCQIQRRPFAVTETQRNSDLYGGNDLLWQQKKNGKEYMMEIERTHLWGEKASDIPGTVGTHPRRFCGGVDQFITTNRTLSTNLTDGNLTYTEMETFLRTAFRYGSSKKFALCSRLVISIISELAHGNIEYRPEDQQAGIAIRRWNSPHGLLYLITHNLLEDPGDATTVSVRSAELEYSGFMYVLDFDAIFFRYLKNRSVKLRTNIQANDEDSRKDEYISECGLQLIHERQHAVMSGVDSVGT